MIRRVVITGLGVVAPNGIGKEDFWQACVGGQSGIRQITRFDASPLPSQIAGEVADFDPTQFSFTQQEGEALDRGTQFALASAILAWRDAGLSAGEECEQPEEESQDTARFVLSEEERERMGVFIGSAMTCVEEGERLWVKVTDGGTRAPASLADEPIIPALLMTHAPAFSIASHYQLYGPCMLIGTGCSAGADAIGEAYWAIQEGHVDRMLAGGADSAISTIGLGVFCVMGALSTAYNQSPTLASRPYDGKRDGFVMAEGAGVVLLEERGCALARGAHIYAEIIAFGSNSNAHHMTALPANGDPLQRLLEQTLADAGIAPEQPDYINSHGSSTPTNEIAETAAYKAIFGERAYAIPISATKSLIGHTQGAASAIETIVTALVLDRQMLPPTINQELADPLCDLDYVPNVARPATVHIALTHSSGFGGVNSVLILARADWMA